jgi:sec-independent protein translocase protein TatB
MNLGMPEMIFIFLLALIIFGPKKMPEIGRQIGRALAEFKKASNDFKSQIEDEIRQLEYDEQQKKIAAAATIEGNAPSYAESASAALVNTSPEGTIAHGSDLHRGEIPEEHGAGESPASNPSNHMTAQGSDA